MRELDDLDVALFTRAAMTALNPLPSTSFAEERVEKRERERK